MTADDQMKIRLVGRPVVVGEVLFDEMPDDTRVLGGAPFNVAWHLQAFGLRPLLISRVGQDGAGDEVLAAMAAWDMDTAGMQRDPSHPTGRVRVSFEGGEPNFHIIPDQAYDHLDLERAVRAAETTEASLLYHGTLVQRSVESGTTLGGLRTQLEAPVFVDVNLRDPWWQPAKVNESVREATWVKLNETELARLTGLSSSGNGAELEAAVAEFRAANSLAAVILTRGSRGALIDDGDVTRAAGPPASVKVVDTVGAGDAFAAVYMLGLQRGWAASDTLARALEFAAAICEIRGATTTDRMLYPVFLDCWEGGEA